MFAAGEAPDQAEAYGVNLLQRARLSDKEKFHLLRATSVTVAGIRAYGRARSSREELENSILSFYLERIVLDLKNHENGIGANLDFEMMKKRCFGVVKDMTKRKLEALEKAIIKAAKKNSAPPDGDNFSGLECNELFLEIKYESNNTFNPIWVKLLNKNGDIPSGVQLNDLLDQVRIEAFNVKDIQRRVYLEASRKRAAEKKKKGVLGVDDTDANEENDENEGGEQKEESKGDEKIKKIRENSPSKPKEMPADFIPTHFLSWLKNGPASDNQHPLWIPDTGKAESKHKADILESSEKTSGNGKLSSYSRKAQRLEASQGKEDSSKVLDLTTRDDAHSGLLRESVKNSSMIVSLLQGVTDKDRKNIDALVMNAAKMYELEPSMENKDDYLAALRRQKELLVKRSLPPCSIEKTPCRAAVDQVDYPPFSDDDLSTDHNHNLDVSLTGEPYDRTSPVLSLDSTPMNNFSIHNSRTTKSTRSSRSSTLV